MSLKVVEVILLMTLVTYGSRALPLLLFKGKVIQGFAREFIEAVPVALLAALVIPELLMPGGSITLVHNPFLWAGVLTFVFAKFVPNLFLGVLFGMVVYWGIDKFIH
ncbi:MAG: AzlD domain-containing protein [Desulfitobacteriaceae bacterium]